MQGNIVILKHCDAIKVMAIGVLQEAMTQFPVGVAISHIKDAVTVFFWVKKRQKVSNFVP